MRAFPGRLAESLASRPFWTCFWVAIGFGLYSLYLGQDTNWDLEKYHRYNPYALLQGRLGLDMAPAGFQSYFNPLLDLPYYLMTQYGPAPLAGFLMGLWHGLTFLLLYLVCAAALGPDEQASAGTASQRLSLKLAALGCLALTFLWGLGNCMGDDSSAVVVLAALAVVARAWPDLAGRRGTVLLVGAGVLAGFGAGLKLTNAPYALALCLAFAAAPAAWPQRLRSIVLFGSGVLVGLAISVGWWWALLWHRFGNPLFPQLGRLFPHPWARPISVADPRFLPRGFGEHVFWPFVFTWHGTRVGEPRLHQLLWPIIYVLFFAAGVAYLLRRRRLGPDAADAGAFAPVRPTSGPASWPKSAFPSYVLAFVALGYLGWMKLFSIYRYVVPIEVLLPLTAWILLHRLLPPQPALRAAKWVLGTSIVVAWIGAVQTWGHYGWSRQAFRVDVPTMSNPAHDTVLIMGEPLAWLIPSFPAQIAVAGVATGFPEDVGFKRDLRALIARREGEVYAISRSRVNWRKQNMARLNSTLRELGWTRHAGFCSALKSIIGVARLHAAVLLKEAHGDGVRCDVTVRADDDPDLEMENAKLLKTGDNELAAYGLAMDFASCRTLPAYIGQDFLPYQWCRVVVLH